MALNPMYSAKIGSPVTTLSSGITSTDTTISVVNSAALPAAPNICTIGEAADSEIVKYAGISGNDLIGVERGFQGTAKSHATGSAVARYFTAYDHDTFRGNILELEQEIGGISLDAGNVSYTNTTSGLTATDVQAAIDEVDAAFDNHSARHETGGADEINLAGLNGESAELATHKADTTTAHGINTKATTNTYTATLLSTGWTGAEAPYSQTIAVVGMTATDNPVVDVDLSGALDYAAEQEILTDWGQVYRIVTGTDEITVYANAETVGDVEMMLKVVR